jgi:hypothetical protein
MRRSGECARWLIDRLAVTVRSRPTQIPSIRYAGFVFSPSCAAAEMLGVAGL